MSIRFGYNSTIARREKTCRSCGKPCYPFSKGRCQPCATREDVMKRMEKVADDTLDKEGLWDLIKEADEIFSRFVRLSAANEHGITFCYICNKPVRWQDANCMHYISRGCLYLRFDLKNCKCGCEECNKYKDGNLVAYGEKLEAELPNVTETLFEYSTLVYRPSKDEIRAIISEYTPKVKELLKRFK